jgi:hypothetical protein
MGQSHEIYLCRGWIGYHTSTNLRTFLKHKVLKALKLFLKFMKYVLAFKSVNFLLLKLQMKGTQKLD